MPIIRLDFNNLRMFKQTENIYLLVKARRTMSFISLSSKRKQMFFRKKLNKIANLLYMSIANLYIIRT